MNKNNILVKLKMRLDEKQLPLYIGVGVFVLLTLSALLFADKFSFLQSKPDSPDSTGKCPNKCCKACSLNLPLVLMFSAGLGVTGSMIAMLTQKSHRDRIKQIVDHIGSTSE